MGQAIGPDDHARFAAHLMRFFGRLDAKRGWSKQLHLGALRNNNSRAFATLGAAAGRLCYRYCGALYRRFDAVFALSENGGALGAK